MKYIDAEKLKSIIKAQIKERDEWMKDIDKSDRQEQLWSDLNGEDMSIIQTISSLQHESTPSKEEIADRIADWISDNTDFFFNGDTKEVMNEIKKLI